jgi:hypothetical protein
MEYQLRKFYRPHWACIDHCLTLVVLLGVFIAWAVVPGKVWAQADMPGSRMFSDKASWVQLALPESWFAPRYRVTAYSGPQAAERQRGAAYWLAFEFLPESREVKPESLLRVAVFPRSTWEKVRAEFGPLRGEMLAQSDTRVYLAVPAETNPYPAGSVDARQFEAMRLSPDTLMSAFSILGASAQLAPRASAPKEALRALPQARLVCTGAEPAWTFSISKGTAARLTTPATQNARAGKQAEKKGAADKPLNLRGRMEFAGSSQAVWRGRAGKSGDWVAVVSEDRCESSSREAGGMAMLLSRPDGRVWQGCCQVSK